MAAIQNARDALLQAASPRVIPIPISPDRIPGLVETIAATKGIKLSAPSNVFQISAGGVASPASITITATLTLVSAPLTWTVVSGTATLTGSGNTRTLSAAAMVSNSVTIRASVQEPGGPIYTDHWTIAKTADGANGANGTNGADGARGSITAFGTLANLVAFPGRSNGRARWAAGSPNEGNAITADSAARNIIWQRLGNSGSAPNNNHLRLGDTVTLTNAGQTVSATGYWTGAAWDTPGTVIDGNLLVGGNVSGQEFTGGTFTGATFRTAASGDRFVMDSNLKAYKDGILVFNVNPTFGHIELKPALSGLAGIKITAGDNYAIDASSNVTAARFRTDSSGRYAVHSIATGAGGVAVLAQATGDAVALQATSVNKFAAIFQTSGQRAPIVLIPRNTIPTDRTAGAICFHSSHGLCVSNGVDWYHIPIGNWAKLT